MIILVCVLITLLLFFIVYKDWNEILTMISLIFSAVAVGTVIVMLVVCIMVHVPMYKKSQLIKYEQQYNIISTTIKNSSGNIIALTNEIADYNSDIIKGRLYQDSIWIGILIEDIYYNLPLIELPVSEE